MQGKPHQKLKNTNVRTMWEKPQKHLSAQNLHLKDLGQTQLPAQLEEADNTVVSFGSREDAQAFQIKLKAEARKRLQRSF